MSENKIIIRQMSSSSDYNYVYPKGWSENQLIVTSEAGTTVTVSLKSTQTYTYGSEETVHTFSLDDGYGTYTITASKDGYTGSYFYESLFVGQHLFTAHAISNVLDNCTWEVIKKASDKNTGATFWSVGDKKSVKINGTIGGYSYNTTLYVFITDFAHNTSVEGTGICFQGFKDENGKDIAMCASNYNDQTTSGFIMNQSNITTGGWNGSYMKQTIIPQFKSALPSDLVNNIKTTTIWTHNNTGGIDNNNASNVTATQETVYLLAEFEIFGSRSYANQYEQNHQTQYQYYKNGNSKIKCNHTSTSSAVFWWERSAYCSDSDTDYFCGAYDIGGAGSNSASNSSGFAPAFKV